MKSASPKLRYVNALFDLNAIGLIERQSFDYPYSLHELSLMLSNGSMSCLVADGGFGGLDGFCITQHFPDHMELVDIAVAKRRRRDRVGTTLLEKATSTLRHAKRPWCHLYVRETNLAALLFFQSFGFVATSLRSSRHANCDDGEVRMVYHKPMGMWERECLTQGA